MRTKSERWSGAALAATILTAAAPCFADPICGATLGPGTVTTLTADLECGGGAYLLNLDSATLNLNGFSVICLNEFGQNDGVRLAGKRSAVNGPGSIIGCDAGVLAAGAGKHLVDGVDVDSAEGVAIAILSDKNLVTHSTVSGKNGIRLYGDKNQVIENEVSTNADGIDVWGSKNRLVNNQLIGNTDAIELRASKNRVTANIVTDPVIGLTIDGDGHTVSENTVISADFDGIRLNGSARILENVVTDNGENGIDVSSPADARVKVADNDVSGSGVTDLFDATSDCGEHKWSRNVFGTADPAGCIE